MAQSSPRRSGPGRPSSGRPRGGAAPRKDPRSASRSGASRGSGSRHPGDRRGSSTPRADQRSSSGSRSGSSPVPRRRPVLTTRALALGLVVAVVALSLVSSLRVWFDQERRIAQTRAEIVAHDDEIDRLNNDLARWQDPDFVRAQARDRLGWVVPGETGYRVLGPDGQPLGTGQLSSTGPTIAGEGPTQWWQNLAGVVRHADAPAPRTDRSDSPITAPTPTKRN